MHHIDGNHQNDKLDNLLVLCPNCHRYTENHSKNVKRTKVGDEEMLEALKNAPSIRQALIDLNMSTAGANYSHARKMVQQYELKHLYKQPKQQNYCVDCGAPIDTDSTRCVKCCQANSSRIFEINRNELKQLIRVKPFTQIGEMFGVTDNAIRKRCKLFKLPFRKKDINSHTDEEWKMV